MTEMRARRLTQAGLYRFQSYLQDLRANPLALPPADLLIHNHFSEGLESEIFPARRQFQTRYEIGQYLVELLAGQNTRSILGDRGFWSWLALYWFDQLCPPAATGARKASKPYNYLLSEDYKHRARHSLRTTWLLVERYGPAVMFLFSREPSVRGELIEQLAARPYYLECRGIIELASHLYFDPQRQSFKSGATSGRRKGNIRRFIAWLQQLELTYDLYTIKKEKLLELLPGEYAAFNQ